MTRLTRTERKELAIVAVEAAGRRASGGGTNWSTRQIAWDLYSFMKKMVEEED